VCTTHTQTHHLTQMECWEPMVAASRLDFMLNKYSPSWIGAFDGGMDGGGFVGGDGGGAFDGGMDGGGFVGADGGGAFDGGMDGGGYGGRDGGGAYDGGF
jgi:hypothetical protein